MARDSHSDGAPMITVFVDPWAGRVTDVFAVTGVMMWLLKRANRRKTRTGAAPMAPGRPAVDLKSP
jgi:hypothetical protein